MCWFCGWKWISVNRRIAWNSLQMFLFLQSCPLFCISFNLWKITLKHFNWVEGWLKACWSNGWKQTVMQHLSAAVVAGSMLACLAVLLTRASMTVVSVSCLLLCIQTSCVLQCTSLLVIVMLVTRVHALCHSVIHPFRVCSLTRGAVWRQRSAGKICHRVSKA